MKPLKAYSSGMTLLEMMASLGLFTLMFVFVVQIVKQNQRQTKKIHQGIQTKSSLSSTLSLIRRDLYQASFHLDLNANLQAHFPMKRGEKTDLEPNNREAPNDITGGNQPPSSSSSASASANKRQLSVFLSEHFVFEGESNAMSFVTYSFSNKTLDNSSPQWIKVRYSAEPCEGSNLCWIRFSDRYWHPDLFKQEEPEEKLILFRNLDRLNFFYTLSEDSTNRLEWRDSWKLPDILSLNQGRRKASQRGLLFPSMVKVELKEEEGEEQSFFFPFSPSYLKAWSPLTRSYTGFPKWKAPRSRRKPPHGKKTEEKNSPNGKAAKRTTSK